MKLLFGLLLLVALQFIDLETVFAWLDAADAHAKAAYRQARAKHPPPRRLPAPIMRRHRSEPRYEFR